MVSEKKCSDKTSRANMQVRDIARQIIIRYAPQQYSNTIQYTDEHDVTSMHICFQGFQVINYSRCPKQFKHYTRFNSNLA